MLYPTENKIFSEFHNLTTNITHLLYAVVCRKLICLFFFGFFCVVKTHNPTVSVKIHNPTVCVTDTHPSPHASLNLVSQRYRNLEKSGGRGVSVYSDFFHGRSEFMDCFFLAWGSPLAHLQLAMSCFQQEVLVPDKLI